MDAVRRSSWHLGRSPGYQTPATRRPDHRLKSGGPELAEQCFHCSVAIDAGCQFHRKSARFPLPGNIAVPQRMRGLSSGAQWLRRDGQLAGACCRDDRLAACLLGDEVDLLLWRTQEGNQIVGAQIRQTFGAVSDWLKLNAPPDCTRAISNLNTPKSNTSRCTPALRGLGAEDRLCGPNHACSAASV
jgi:hypothetical protein